MSLAPADPTPSKAPEAVNHQEPPPSTSESDDKESDRQLPHPVLRVELRDLRHEATRVFLDNINAASDVANLVDTVVQILYYPSKSSSTEPAPTSDSQPESSRDGQKPLRPHPYKPHVPGTRSVTLVLRDMDGVAYTTGLELDDDHKEIHFSLSYISGVAKRFSSASRSTSTSTSASQPTNSATPPDSSPVPSPSSWSTTTSNHEVRKELLGVICHELVHCYQHNALGSAPGGLIEGMADFVRLRAGFVPPHWKREGGRKWDAGYQTTGYFLDWLEGRCGEGTVRRLNGALREKEYKKSLWVDLFGEGVETLWGEYCKSLNE
ncbi:hypothetical protein C1H76_2608 [Elsinoe australis]|uniref:Uncharacterized protein n=1 Tax=Elsinoe australis TaxID=40998 RepID=A0A4U7B8H7_9PEZI|nr:hypothetical protein C1H76_2608 [Elsinoe australis]